jgi:hypothetical protein
MHAEIIKNYFITSCKGRSSGLWMVKDATKNNVATTIDFMMFFLMISWRH